MKLKDNKELLKEWDYEKNKEIGLNIDTILCGSNKKAWWKCSKGHSYYKPISERALSHEGCPYCSNQRVLQGYNDFATKEPDLLKEWDWEKNDKLGIDPHNTISGKGVKVWWKCGNCGYEWQSTISNRKKHRNCPLCTNQIIIKGINDLEYKRPDLMKEWDYKKNANKGLFPDKIAPGSNKSAWWICKNKHSYYKKISERSLFNEGCPYCTGRRVLAGYNDFKSQNPELMKEWDWEKNNSISLYPDKVTSKSSKYAYWKCEKGHEWKAVIASRANGRKCPYCSHSKILKGYTDLKTTNPDLLKEWDYAKNNNKGIYPENLSRTSKIKAWWICPKGHSYLSSIDKRATRNQGCPYCSGQKFLRGFNDFETQYPEIAKEWHPLKNGDLKPSDIPAKSYKKYWWKCSKGHEWQATPHDRGSGHTNCPICNGQNQTSFPEQCIYFYVQKIWPNSINRYKDIFSNGMELDIFIPNLALGIEYDGIRYHNGENSINKEKKKYNICKQNHIKLLRIKEGQPKLDGNYIADYIIYIENPKNLKELQEKLQLLVDYLDPETNLFTRKFLSNRESTIRVNLNKDRNTILKKYMFEDPHSFAKERPELLKYWDKEKNEGINPDSFSYGSHYKAYWKCPNCGNEWYCSFNTMSGRKNGCIFCSKKKK